MDLKDEMQVALSAAVRAAKQALETCNEKFDSLSDSTEDGKRQLYPGSGELEDLADDLCNETNSVYSLADTLTDKIDRRQHLCCIEGTC